MSGCDHRRAPSAHGTYALMMRCRRAGSVTVGSLGPMRIDRAVYLYLGSAFGPGGLRARLSRHASRCKIDRWHIDYLRPRMSLDRAWYSASPTHLEHAWAAHAIALPTATVPLPHFGASDCRCLSHLIRFPDSDSSRRSIRDALAATSDDSSDQLSGRSFGQSFGELDAAELRQLARRRR